MAPDLSHLDAWAAIYGNDTVMAHIGEPMSRQQVWNMMAGRIGHWYFRGYGGWTFRDRKSGEICGVGGLFRPDGQQEIEIGWMLLAEYWGKGYATEAACAIATFGFEQAGAHRLLACISPANTGSIKVAIKIGLRLDAATSDENELKFYSDLTTR